MKGLSSTALAKTTNFALAVSDLSVIALMVSPINLTASKLIPAFEEPIFTLDMTRSVSVNARGIDLIKAKSPLAKPFCTNAEYPPIKSTPTALAASSKAWA